MVEAKITTSCLALKILQITEELNMEQKFLDSIAKHKEDIELISRQLRIPPAYPVRAIFSKNWIFRFWKIKFQEMDGGEPLKRQLDDLNEIVVQLRTRKGERMRRCNALLRNQEGLCKALEESPLQLFVY